MTKSFQKETDLCALFMKCLPSTWTAYPETGGFDILLSRNSDGFQIGVEAKLRLNAKVIEQAMEGRSFTYCDRPGPDCRAVLVPHGASGGMGPVCSALGITVIRMLEDLALTADGEPIWFGRKQGPDCGMAGVGKAGEECWTAPFRPSLPRADNRWCEEWFERCPDKRLKLPEYIPDVAAGDTAPVSLTAWKIKAIKIAVTLEKRGYVTRRDFKHFSIDMSRWIDPFSGWLVKNGEGGWIKGDGLPDFRRQHPLNYAEIEADFEEWKAPAEASQPGLFSTGEAGK